MPRVRPATRVGIVGSGAPKLRILLGAVSTRYQVDLKMLREWVPESSSADLERFCDNLQGELFGGEAVPAFEAVNDPRDMELTAWAWPTDQEWRRAIELTFGVATLPTPRERELLALGCHKSPRPRPDSA